MLYFRNTAYSFRLKTTVQVKVLDNGMFTGGGSEGGLRKYSWQALDLDGRVRSAEPDNATSSLEGLLTRPFTRSYGKPIV